MADYGYRSNGQLAVAPEVRAPWLRRKEKRYGEYKPTLIENTETYNTLISASKLHTSSIVTIVLTVVAIALGLIFAFRVAGIFAINRETRKLTKQSEKITAHLTLEDNKTIAKQSDRNAADIAAANQMRKLDAGDVVVIETDDSEFTRVYYGGETKSEKPAESLVEKIENFLGIVKKQ